MSARTAFRPPKTRTKHSEWVKHTGANAGVCFTISWGRLTQLVEADLVATKDFNSMFANRLRKKEFVERFEADATGVTVFIGELED